MHNFPPLSEITIPLSSITRGPNPRRYFSPEAHAALTESIRANGILQKILVRSKPESDKYEIVAGERRYRAAVEAWGIDAEIAVMVGELTDEQALLAAIEENEQRDNPSETEQADAAKRLLEMYNGDRAEAARRLGWPKSKFERRMALTKLSSEVKKALDNRQIMLGHAELLAAIPFDKQNKALTTITEKNLTAVQTRELLIRLTHSLAEANFDKSDCKTCPFNSASQRALFETCVDDGLCTNPACYETKAQQQEIKDQLTKANADKEKKSLETCPNILPSHPNEFTATTSSVDSESEIQTDDNQQSIKETKSKNIEKPEPSDQTDAIDSSASKTKSDGNEDLVRLRDQIRRKTQPTRESIWRYATAKSVMNEPEKSQAVILTAAFNGDLNDIDRNQLPTRAEKFLGKEFTSNKTSQKLEVVSTLDNSVRVRALAAIAASYVQATKSFSNVESIAHFYKTEISSTWKITPEFLNAYTKAEIKFIVMECGVVDKVGAKTFNKMASGKVSDFIKALFALTDFDWSGRIPSSMSLDGGINLPKFP